MGILDSIWSAGEDLISGNDSPLGGIISGVIDGVGNDGFNGIVDQITGSSGGVWGTVSSVVENELGSEWGGFVTGVKDLAADGDATNLWGSVVGGVRDYVGDDRFDVIAGTVGEAVSGSSDGWWGELKGHITEAVGSDGLTAVIDGVTNVVGEENIDNLLGSVVEEAEGLVGEEAWGVFTTAATIADAADQEEAAEEPGDGETINPFDESPSDDTASDEAASDDTASDDSAFDDADMFIGGSAEFDETGGDFLTAPIPDAQPVMSSDVDLGPVFGDAPIMTAAPQMGGNGVGTLDLELEPSGNGVGTLDLELEPSGNGIGTLDLELEPSAPAVDPAPVVEAAPEFEQSIEAADSFTDSVNDFFDGLD